MTDCVLLVRKNWTVCLYGCGVKDYSGYGNIVAIVLVSFGRLGLGGKDSVTVGFVSSWTGCGGTMGLCVV